MEVRLSSKQLFFMRCAVLTASVFIMLSALEISVRVFAKPADILNRRDASVGRIYQKNFKGFVWEPEAGRETYIVTNKLGYVGKDVDLERGEGVVRIAMLGDSMTAALQVDYVTNFTSRLEDLLNTQTQGSGRTFEVLNYGVGGTGTFLQYQTYIKNIAPYKPDAVFLIFFTKNDYHDNYAKLNFDLEEYENQRSKIIPSKVLLSKSRLVKLVFRKLQGNALFLWTISKAGFEEEVREQELKLLSQEEGELEQTEEFYDYTFEIIEKLTEQVEGDGAEFLVVILPPGDAYEKLDSWRQDAKIIKLIDFLEKTGIEYLNSAELLAQAQELYPGKCFTNYCAVGHFNELGHEVFAGILADVIKEGHASWR